MIKQHWRKVHSICSFLALAGLVSCSLGGPLRQDVKAKGYDFKAPRSSRWVELKEKADADFAWSSKSSAATLSIKSLCHRYEHVPLKALSQNLINTVSNSVILKQEEITLAQRTALKTEFSGELDGVTLYSQVVVVRKNHCLFDFSLMQIQSLNEQNIKDFHLLIESFDYRGQP